MQKNYRLIVSIIALTISGLGAFAQSEVEYKDVILNGKPAKLNVATGEITLVSPINEKKVDTSIVAKKSVQDTVSSVNTSDFHIVKDGETLFKIANRYNSSLTELKKANNLETTLVDIGQKLRIRNFDAVTESSYIAASIANPKKHISNFHIVKKGETLYGLTRRYNLSLNELKSKNNLNTNLIKVGQKLRVRDFETKNDANQDWVWIVSKGDTLFSIAKRSGVTIDAIKKLNKLTSNNIMIGQMLQLK